MKNEIDLRLGIWDFEDISPEKLTQLIGLEPFKVFVKGQPKNHQHSTLSKTNGWIYKPTVDKYLSFKEQMDLMLDAIESKKDIFKKLCNAYHCEFSCALYIYIDIEESTPWVHLDNRYNELIKELKIEFDLDIILLADKE